MVCICWSFLYGVTYIALNALYTLANIDVEPTNNDNNDNDNNDNDNSDDDDDDDDDDNDDWRTLLAGMFHSYETIGNMFLFPF